MRFLLFEHIAIARQSLRSNRMRSALTMLGITIGVASVTTIFALSGGASKIVTDQVDGLGGNIAVIRPGLVSETPYDDLAQFPARQNYAASSLTTTDVSRIQQIDNVEAAAPLMIMTGSVAGASPAPINTPIIATTPDLEVVNDLDIREGQFLDPNIKRETAVIGPQLSVDIFGTEASIGKNVTIRGQAFTIIGVLERANNPINYNGVDFDSAVIINEDSGRVINQGALQIQQINVRSNTVANLDQIIIDTNKTLLKTHLDQADFTVLSGEEIAQPTNQLFYAIAGTTAAIAAISLIVGGIGIMNILLVSVAERTREIGIRKAVGASNSDIVSQFLIESLGLSIGGGIAGYIVGYVVAFIISISLTFDPIFTWQIAAMAIGISIIIGTIFGLYPAIRAARKDPITALRHYN